MSIFEWVAAAGPSPTINKFLGVNSHLWSGDTEPISRSLAINSKIDPPGIGRNLGVNSLLYNAELLALLGINAKLSSGFDVLLPVNSYIFVSSGGTTFTNNVQERLTPTVNVNSLLGRSVFFVKNWNGSSLRVTGKIYKNVSASLRVASNLLVVTPVSNTLRVSSTLAPAAPETTPDTVGNTVVRRIPFSVFFDSVDVTNEVRECKVSYSRDQFCGEVDITWNSLKYFRLLDCTDLALNYRIERLQVYANGILLGHFFNEKRTMSTSFGESSLTSWGRTRPARLSNPYAVVLTGEVDEGFSSFAENDSTAYTVAKAICDKYGVELRWEVMDYKVRAGKLPLKGQLPIDVLKTLATTIGAIVTSSRFAPFVLVRYKWLEAENG